MSLSISAADITINRYYKLSHVVKVISMLVTDKLFVQKPLSWEPNSPLTIFIYSRFAAHCLGMFVCISCL